MTLDDVPTFDLRCEAFQFLALQARHTAVAWHTLTIRQITHFIRYIFHSAFPFLARLICLKRDGVSKDVSYSGFAYSSVTERGGRSSEP